MNIFFLITFGLYLWILLYSPTTNGQIEGSFIYRVPFSSPRLFYHQDDNKSFLSTRLMVKIVESEKSQDS